MKSRRPQVAALLAIVCVAGTASASWFLDWAGTIVLGQTEWVMTGAGTASRSVVSFFDGSPTPCSDYAGAQTIDGRGNMRFTAATRVSDISTTGCSAVTVEITGWRGAGRQSSCQQTTPQAGSFESKSWSTCNGSNTHWMSSAWFGRVGEDPISITGADFSMPVLGDNVYHLTLRLTDDFGSRWQNTPVNILFF
jgi:hypothetical protein